MREAAGRTERRRDGHLQPHLLLVPLAILGQRGEQRERASQVPDRLLVGRPLRRALAGPPVVRDRGRDHARLLVMPREHLGLGLGTLRETRLQCRADARVELLARSLQQRLVRRVLDQRVLEHERGVRRLAAHEQDARVDQPRQVPPQRRVVPIGDRREQRVRELAPQRRRPLRQLLRGGQTIETPHQRVGERGGYRVSAPRRVGLEHRPRQLLDVERHTVGTGDERVDGVRGQRVRGECRDHVARLALAQPAQRERRHVLAPGPRRRELGSRGEHDEERRGCAPLDQDSQQLERRRVPPV